jgi:hypothetical protein
MSHFTTDLTNNRLRLQLTPARLVLCAFPVHVHGVPSSVPALSTRSARIGSPGPRFPRRRVCSAADACPLRNRVHPASPTRASVPASHRITRVSRSPVIQPSLTPAGQQARSLASAASTAADLEAAVWAAREPHRNHAQGCPTQRSPSSRSATSYGRAAEAAMRADHTRIDSHSLRGHGHPDAMCHTPVFPRAYCTPRLAAMMA